MTGVCDRRLSGGAVDCPEMAGSVEVDHALIGIINPDDG
jgi:hypothetical protein